MIENTHDNGDIIASTLAETIRCGSCRGLGTMHDGNCSRCFGTGLYVHPKLREAIDAHVESALMEKEHELSETKHPAFSVDKIQQMAVRLRALATVRGDIVDTRISEDDITELLAILDAYADREPWQPIESANIGDLDEDGFTISRFLTCRTYGGKLRTVIGRWVCFSPNDYGWCAEGQKVNPLYWMPLPAPPRTEGS